MNVKMYIGLTTKDGRFLSPDDVIKEVSELVNNFTVINSIDYYNGQQENSLVFEFYDITIIKNDICKLAKVLNQECIGVYLLDDNKFELCFSNEYDASTENFDNNLNDYYLFNN